MSTTKLSTARQSIAGASKSAKAELSREQARQSDIRRSVAHAYLSGARASASAVPARANAEHLREVILGLELLDRDLDYSELVEAIPGAAEAVRAGKLRMEEHSAMHFRKTRLEIDDPTIEERYKKSVTK